MMQTNQILLSFAFVKLIFYGEDRHVFLLFIKKSNFAKNIVFTIAETDLVHKHKHTSNLSSGEEM